MKKYFILCLSLCLFLHFHPAHAWDEGNPHAMPSIPEIQEKYKDQKIDCPSCGKIPDGFLKDWEKDKAYIEKLNRSEDLSKCDLYYNILWGWAKKGNLNARNTLFMQLISHPWQSDNFFLPTATWDVMTKNYYLNTLAVHQIGSDEEKNKEYIDFFGGNIIDFQIKDSYGLKPDSDFGKCMSKERSQKCVEEAVKDGLIPSFDRFARQIDALYAAGFMPICAEVSKSMKRY